MTPSELVEFVKPLLPVGPIAAVDVMENTYRILISMPGVPPIWTDPEPAALTLIGAAVASHHEFEMSRITAENLTTCAVADETPHGTMSWSQKPMERGTDIFALLRAVLDAHAKARASQ